MLRVLAPENQTLFFDAFRLFQSRQEDASTEVQR